MTVIGSVEADSGVGPDTHSQDQLRTMRLLFDRELATGLLASESLGGQVLERATRVRGVPARPMRVAEQVRYKLGRLDFESHVAPPLRGARQKVLERAAAPPRFIVRVDEFPHYRAWDEPGRFGTAGFERFHEIMVGSGVPYLVAVLPRVSRLPLSPEESDWRRLEDEELAMLRRAVSEGVSLGLHGLDHRTRFPTSRRHSELCGLSTAATERLLDEALAELAPHGIRPTVFVPPYNRFDAAQYSTLAARFKIVCGGPESIGTMGFHSTPQWRGEAVYLPSYAPLYGHASEVLPAAELAIERGSGLWEPIVLHWGWELEEGWVELERLAERIAPYTASWEDFDGAIERSRVSGGPVS